MCCFPRIETVPLKGPWSPSVMVSGCMLCDFFTYLLRRIYTMESLCVNFFSFSVTNSMEQNPS